MTSFVNCIDLNHLPEFQPFPAAATRVLAAYEDPNAEPRQIAEIIQCDPTISMRMLSVANSATYGFSNTIGTIEQAIVVMGFRAAKNLVLSVAASAAFEGGAKAIQAKRRLWQHSLGCAAVARLVARQIGVCPDEAFLAAVVHDLGKLIMLEAAEGEYLRATENVNSECITTVEADSFGLTHTELGERYADEWGLPGEIIDAIACHHEPTAAIGGGRLAGVVCVANSIAISHGLGHKCNANEDISAAVARSPFTLDERTIQEISENAAVDYQSLRDSCG